MTELKFELCSNKISTTRETLQSIYIIGLIRIPVVEDGMEEGNSKKRLKVELHTKQPTNSIQYSAENIVLGHLLSNKCRYLVSQPLVLPPSIHSLHSRESHFSKIKIWLCQFLCKQDLTIFRINSLVAANGPSWSGYCPPHQLSFSLLPLLHVPWGPGITGCLHFSHATMFSNLDMVLFPGAFFPLFYLASSYIYP